MNYAFRFPGLFTALSFGVYSSQATATIYVDGTMGGRQELSSGISMYCDGRQCTVLVPVGSPNEMQLPQRQRKQINWWENTFCTIAPRQEYFWRQQCCLKRTEYHRYRAYRMWKNGSGTGLRCRPGRSAESTEGRFRKESGIYPVKLRGTYHVHGSAARGRLCMGEQCVRSTMGKNP